MKRIPPVLLLLALLAAGCTSTTATPAVTETPSLAIPSLPAETETPIPSTQETASPAPLLESVGPTDFPAGVNPLTGLQVANPALLERRPMLIKVSNLPRSVRPQWGLSRADLVFEYYTEEGTTRFAALFYGNDAEMVGPIRSARFVDVHLVRGYDAILAFGSAYEKVIDRLFGSEFADRLVLETPESPLQRYDPNGYNHLVVNTAELSAFITQQGVENGPQNLDGMFFQIKAPQGGEAATEFVVRYSNSIYNRWQYDAGLGKYLRSADTRDDLDDGRSEDYAQSTDRLTGENLAFDNVVVLYVLNEYYNVSPEVMDIQLLDSGEAFLFRDGQAYQVQWQRSSTSVVTLANLDGSPFPFKPGTTWFEIIGLNSTLEKSEAGIRFLHLMP